ncbi:MAG: hypothetical protein IJV14_05170, partial [Lachnospiraceae bacterium]|nr:hypothetical protein [Lachnospiraceae bacterium]
MGVCNSENEFKGDTIMSEKKITGRDTGRIKQAAKELEEAKKLKDGALCGTEPIVLDKPKNDGNDPSCGTEPVVLDRPRGGEPEDPCGNGRIPGGKIPRPKEPRDPRLGKKIKK